MPASAALINQANTVLAGANLAQIFSFLSATPVQPPDGSVAGLNVDNKAKTTGGANLGNVEYSQIKLIDPVDRIAFIKFVADPLFPDTLSFQVQYARQLQTQASRAGYIPIWFLPWSSKRVLKLKIEDASRSTLTPFGTSPAPLASSGIAPLPNPGIFFTAAINGCSVFAVGGTRDPNVYHAGITGSLDQSMPTAAFNALGGTSEAVWHSLVEGAYFSAAGDITPKTAAQHKHGTTKQARHAHFGEVNRSDYVAERLPSGAVLSRGTLPGGAPKLTTSKAIEIEKRIERKTGVTDVEVNPWGAVFGLRDSTGSWSFYLVKNAIVSYTRYRWQKGFGLIPYARTTNGVVPTRTVINLGFQQFFPGSGETHYRAFNVKSLL
ncbi:MAG TPA: hypothetical protein VFW98_02210 [Gemmatimonadaceae bacterium]|nr:hypothetical protein [Gemmatimonadaceae bacterium]